jgi:hypothetical protein
MCQEDLEMVGEITRSHVESKSHVRMGLSFHDVYKREHYFTDDNYFFIAICNSNVTMSSIGSIELFKLLSNASNIVNGLFYLQNSSDM